MSPFPKARLLARKRITNFSCISTQAAYLPLIKHLRELIAARQKKSYTVAVGKLNPAKLANFLEVECFVLVACPENTLIESKVSIAA